jgi:hypothetical protein
MSSVMLLWRSARAFLSVQGARSLTTAAPRGSAAAVGGGGVAGGTRRLLPATDAVAGPAAAIELPLLPHEEALFARLQACVRELRLGTTLRVAGGWVRDRLLGRPDTGDIDIAVDNMTGERFAGELMGFIRRGGGARGGGGGSAAAPGAGFGVVRSNPAQSKHLETAVVTVDGVSMDVASLRREDYANAGSRIPSTSALGTPAEDASRRDFTVNALFYNLATRRVEDLTGRGLADLAARVLRTPAGRPAFDTLAEDPLRALRCVRFACALDFDVDPQLQAALADPRIEEAVRLKLSRERIGLEVLKALDLPAFPRCLHLLQRFGLRDAVFRTPEPAPPALPARHTLFFAPDAGTGGAGAADRAARPKQPPRSPGGGPSAGVALFGGALAGDAAWALGVQRAADVHAQVQQLDAALAGGALPPPLTAALLGPADARPPPRALVLAALLSPWFERAVRRGLQQAIVAAGGAAAAQPEPPAAMALALVLAAEAAAVAAAAAAAPAAQASGASDAPAVAASAAAAVRFLSAYPLADALAAQRFAALPPAAASAAAASAAAAAEAPPPYSVTDACAVEAEARLRAEAAFDVACRAVMPVVALSFKVCVCSRWFHLRGVPASHRALRARPFLS